MVWVCKRYTKWFSRFHQCPNSFWIDFYPNRSVTAWFSANGWQGKKFQGTSILIYILSHFGPWNKSLTFFFLLKIFVIPHKFSQVTHWLSQLMLRLTYRGFLRPKRHWTQSCQPKTPLHLRKGWIHRPLARWPPITFWEEMNLNI